MNATVWLPTNPPRQAPLVLTAEETVMLLRIDSRNPRATLEYYRSRGKLRGKRIGKSYKYHLDDVLNFIRSQFAKPGGTR